MLIKLSIAITHGENLLARFSPEILFRAVRTVIEREREIPLMAVRWGT